MSPSFRSLYRPAAREWAAVSDLGLGLDPSADPLVVTPFDPMLHVAEYPRPPGEVLAVLNTVEHGERDQGRVVRRSMPLVVHRNGRWRVPLGLVPLIDQYMTYTDGTPSTVTVPDPARFPDSADPCCRPP